MQEAPLAANNKNTLNDKSAFDSDEDIKEMVEAAARQSEEPVQPTYVIEKAILDINQVDPSKVNWFKYLVDKYLNEETNSSVLNSTDAYANLLHIILCTKKNEEIQDELLDLVGFDNFELLTQLLEKREFIKEYCGQINERLAAQKAQENSYRAKNFDYPRGNIGVSVIF